MLPQSLKVVFCHRYLIRRINPVFITKNINKTEVNKRPRLSAFSFAPRIITVLFRDKMYDLVIVI